MWKWETDDCLFKNDDDGQGAVGVAGDRRHPDSERQLVWTGPHLGSSGNESATPTSSPIQALARPMSRRRILPALISISTAISI